MKSILVVVFLPLILMSCASSSVSPKSSPFERCKALAKKAGVEAYSYAVEHEKDSGEYSCMIPLID